MKNKLPLIRRVLLLFCVFYLVCALYYQLRATDTSPQDGSPMLYYILNVDGMKGLGHSALFITNENGAGKYYSYNGMQYNLWQSLLGNAGVGYLYTAELSPEETKDFLENGNIYDGLSGETENYDWAACRMVTAQQSAQIQEASQIYIDTANQFQTLLGSLAAETDTIQQERLELQLEEFCSSGVPLYQIYKNNCDDTTRLLIAQADQTMGLFNQTTKKLTPCGTFKSFLKQNGSGWGVVKLGSDTWKEKILSFFNIF